MMAHFLFSRPGEKPRLVEYRFSFETKHLYGGWYYYVYAEAEGKRQLIKPGNTQYQTKRDATAAAEAFIAEQERQSVK